MNEVIGKLRRRCKVEGDDKTRGLKVRKRQRRLGQRHARPAVLGHVAQRLAVILGQLFESQIQAGTMREDDRVDREEEVPAAQRTCGRARRASSEHPYNQEGF